MRGQLLIVNDAGKCERLAGPEEYSSSSARAEAIGAINEMITDPGDRIELWAVDEDGELTGTVPAATYTEEDAE